MAVNLFATIKYISVKTFENTGNKSQLTSEKRAENFHDRPKICQ